MEAFECKEGKVSQTVKLFSKMDVQGTVLMIVDQKDALIERATRNIPGVKTVQAQYLSTFDVLNADILLFTSQKALAATTDWLGEKK